MATPRVGGEEGGGGDGREDPPAGLGWWMLDLQTDMAAWANAPAGTIQLLAATPDDLLLVMRDDLDEEDIRIFRIER